MSRGDEFAKDAHTCVVHVCVFNTKGEMLIQQRQPFKTTWPGLWDLSIGGHIEAGETSEDSAERELFEELGIKRDFSNERPHFTINFVIKADLRAILKKQCGRQPLTWAGRPVSTEPARFRGNCFKICVNTL